MKKIIVLCEANDHDEVVLHQVAPLAKAFGSQLYLIHVAAPDPDFIGYEPGPQHERDRRAAVLCNEHQKIQDSAAMLRKRGLDSTALLLQGETIPTILKEASRLHADLVVIGNHHHGKLYEILSGSVADCLIEQATCPLLLVPVDL